MHWGYALIGWRHRSFLGGAGQGLSESNSQAELNRARWVHLRRHNAEAWVTYLLVWRTESYMIERIKEFRGELQIHTLCDVVAFCDGEVPVVHVIHTNRINVPGRVAESDLRGSIYRLEAGRVEPAVGCPGLTRARCLQVAPRYKIRPHPEALRSEVTLTTAKLAKSRPREKLVRTNGDT